MTDINVDDFCKDAARTLLALYAAFPRPLTLYVEDIAGPDETDEFGMHSDRHLACFSAFLWLAEEGWVRFGDTIRQEAVDQVVLTGRAFTLLSTPVPGGEMLPDEMRGANDIPESVRQEYRTRVHRLERSLAERSSTRIRAAMMDLMAAFNAAAGR